jgi:hypothetical protein
MIFHCGATVNGFTAGHNSAKEARTCSLFNLAMRDDGVGLESIGRILHPELADATKPQIILAAEEARAKHLAARPNLAASDVR